MMRSSLIRSDEYPGGVVDDSSLVFLIPIVAIIGVFAYSIVRTLARSRVRELEIRERIAMIERGLVPAPEVDPRGFDRAMGRLDLHERRRERLQRRMQGGGARHRRAGVTLIGVGFGLMLLIAFTSGDESVAIGVGGFLVVVGLAFFVNSFIDNASSSSQDAVSDPHSWGGAPPHKPASATPPEPPRPTNS
jgi:Domain of unknown function (DUF6249)